MRPKFSIIVPTFNLELYITECLRSIESQTIGKDKFELIIVDDRSSDTTCTKIKSFLENSLVESRFHQLSTNQGPGVARNKGIDLAKGDFLLFVDGDDGLSKDCLEEIETIISKSAHDIDAIAYNWDYLENKTLGNIGSHDKALNGQRRDLDLALLPPKDRVKSYLGMGMDGSVIYTAIRKSIFHNNQILFLPGLHEDIDVIYKIYWHCQVIKGTEKTLYFKRDRAGSIVRTLSKTHIKGYHRAWHEIGNYTKSRISSAQWDTYLKCFLSGITGATAIVILKIFNSFPDDKDARARLYEFTYECYLHFYHCFVNGWDLPKETYYDRIAGEFLAIFEENLKPLRKRELLDAFIEPK